MDYEFHVEKSHWPFLFRAVIPIRFFKILLLWGLVSGSLSAYGVIETYEFENAEQEARYQYFTEVLRCPKCQNQNLEGSDSAIAADLRRELATQILSGKDDDEIVDFMVARFGDFVLYDPPFKASTWLLWLAPAGLLIAGFLAVIFFVRRQQINDTAVPETAHASPLPTTTEGLSKRQGMIGLVIAMLAVSSVSAYLYERYGAHKSLLISHLANNFYSEAARAMHEQREVDPALARELLVRLKQKPRAQDADTSGSDLQYLYLQGSLHVYLSEFEAAIPYYKEYLMAVPTDERVLTEYVQILYLAADRQLTERVQFVVTRALELNPHNQEVLSLLAMHYFEQGDFQQAAAYWRKILAIMGPLDPGRPLLEQAVEAAESARKKG